MSAKPALVLAPHPPVDLLLLLLLHSSKSSQASPAFIISIVSQPKLITSTPNLDQTITRTTPHHTTPLHSISHHTHHSPYRLSTPTGRDTPNLRLFSPKQKDHWSFHLNSHPYQASLYLSLSVSVTQSRFYRYFDPVTVWNLALLPTSLF